MPLHGCIFDLDGVLTDTAEYHSRRGNGVLTSWVSHVSVTATKRSAGSHAALRWQCASPGASLPKRRCGR